MRINYPTAVKWTEQLTADPMEHLGKNNRARLRSTLNKIDDSTISHQVTPLTTDIIDWFSPLYNEAISQKENAKIFDIYSSTLGKGTDIPYFALILYEDGQAVGATIFAERKTILSIAYRIYPHQWQQHKLQANPSLYTEYLIRQYACSQGYHQLTHGKDRNPYGVNSNIGLALFKMSVGCQIYLPNAAYEICTGDLQDFDQDALILLQPEDAGRQITEGILYATSEVLEKYTSITKYPDIVNIQTITRPA